MDFSKYSTAQLCVLIREASRELESRLPKANYTVAVAPPEPVELPTIDKPNNAELKHVEGCIRLLSRGGVIRANDVHEYRRIYKQYPDYMRRYSCTSFALMTPPRLSSLMQPSTCFSSALFGLSIVGSSTGSGGATATV